MDKIYEKNSSFHVKKGTMGKVQFLFPRYFYRYWQNFCVGGRTKHETIISWSFEIFLIFPNFLRSYVLSHSTTCETTRIYEFIINNQASFYFVVKVKFAQPSKVSKYHEHDYLQNLFLIILFLLGALIVKNSHILAAIYDIFLKNVLD